MSYAPESGSPEVLKRIKKAVKLDKLDASVMGAVRNKLNVKLGLCAYKDFSQSISYTEGLSPRVLNVYRILGFLVYGTQYAVHPWRMVTLLRNLLQHRQESRLDKSLQNLAHRMGNRRRSKPAVTVN